MTETTKGTAPQPQQQQQGAQQPGPAQTPQQTGGQAQPIFRDWAAF